MSTASPRHNYEVAEKTVEQIDALEKETQAFRPALAALSKSMQTFSARCAEIEATMRRDFPDRAKRWLGESYVSVFKDKFQRLLLLETQRIVMGTTSATAQPDFATATSSRFELFHRAIKTATRQHDSDGRQKYRAVTNINGLSGGLNIQHGEEIFLPDDAETKKFVTMGVLVMVEGAQ